MNSYILISAKSERQSEEGADTDQLGRRGLAAEVFAAVCYFRGGGTIGKLKRETMTLDRE